MRKYELDKEGYGGVTGTMTQGHQAEWPDEKQHIIWSSV